MLSWRARKHAIKTHRKRGGTVPCISDFWTGWGKWVSLRLFLMIHQKVVHTDQNQQVN